MRRVESTGFGDQMEVGKERISSFLSLRIDLTLVLLTKIVIQEEGRFETRRKTH